MSSAANTDWLDELFSNHSEEEIAVALEAHGVRMSAFDKDEEADTEAAQGRDLIYVVAEGDVRCNEPKDACKCLLAKGHDGPHECPHGYWTELVDVRV